MRMFQHPKTVARPVGGGMPDGHETARPWLLARPSAATETPASRSMFARGPERVELAQRTTQPRGAGLVPGQDEAARFSFHGVPLAPPRKRQDYENLAHDLDNARLQAGPLRLPPQPGDGTPPSERGPFLPERPYTIGQAEYDAMRWEILRRLGLPKNRGGLTEVDAYALLYTTGYEGWCVDPGNPNYPLTRSKAGVTQRTLEDATKYKNDQINNPNARQFALPANVDALTPANVVDMQSYYFDQNTGLARATTATGLSRFGPPELATQIGEVVYQNNSDTRATILQQAANETILALSSFDRQRLGASEIAVDQNLGSLTVRALQRLASDPAVAAALLFNIRRQRAQWMIDHNQYSGASRARVWGMLTQQP
jgi:hypothetical protein